MVSIVEFEIFGYLPFSNWPDFDQKWSKIGHFGPQMAQNKGLSNFSHIIMSYFFLILCLKLYLNTLEHKSQWLPWENSFLALFGLFRDPQNSTFWWFKSVF